MSYYKVKFTLMETLTLINFLFMAGYIALGSRLIKTVNRTRDVLELRFNHAPYYFKYIGLALILISIGIYIWVSKVNSLSRAEEMLLYHINLGFLLLVFSCERNEDELFNQIRQKAIVASFIVSLLLYAIVIPSVIILEEIHHEWLLSFGAILVFFNFSYLIYFYSTKRRMRK